MNYNRIKIADLETNQSDKILTTNSNGEIEFSNINEIKADNYNALDYTQEGKALDARQGKVLKDLIDNIKENLKPYFETLFLGISNDQNISGIKTFLSGKLGLRNVANTFTSFFSNSNTASRTYTLQNRDGVLLDNTDLSTINASLAGKQSLFTGTANYIPKSLNSTTLIPSRLIDNGSSLGINTTKSPSKDFTLGNQTNREIGIEESSNIIHGRDLTIRAGRTINYIENINFNPLNQFKRGYTASTISPNGDIYVSCGYFSRGIYLQSGGIGDFIAIDENLRNWRGMASLPNGNIYVIVENEGLYVRIGGTGNFIPVSNITPRSWRGLCASSNGNLYACVPNGDVYMQTGGVGDFVPLGQVSRRWQELAGAPNGDIYACVENGDIYKQTGGVGDFISLGQETRLWRGITVAPNGNVYACVGTGPGGDIYMQTAGIGNFVPLGQTTRFWYGMATHPNGNIYACAGGGAILDDMYMQQNNSFGSSDLNGGKLSLIAGTGKGVGQSRVEFITGAKKPSGTDMQLETVRAYIDENGYMVWSNMPTYPDNTTAIAAGLPIGCEYKTATGDRKIVY